MDISRRNVLVGAASLGTVSLVERPARAALQCVNTYDPFGRPVRVCQAGLPSPMIHMAAVTNTQNQSQWCWAACIAMIFRYYGHPVQQGTIVSAVFGAPVNNPGQPWQIISALNRTWKDDNGREFRSTSGNGSTDAASAALDLEGNQPLIVGTMGHAMVLTALTYAAPILNGPWGPTLGPVSVTDAVVRDPWPGRGVRSLTPQEYLMIMFAARVRVESLSSDDDDDDDDDGH